MSTRIRRRRGARPELSVRRSGIYRGEEGQILLGPRWRLGALGIALFALGQLVLRLLDQTADGDA